METEVRCQLEAEAKEGIVPYVTSWERMGIEKGLEQALRQTVEDGLRTRFPLAAEALLPVVQQCRDAATLRKITNALMAGVARQSVQALRIHRYCAYRVTCSQFQQVLCPRVFHRQALRRIAAGQCRSQQLLGPAPGITRRPSRSTTSIPRYDGNDNFSVPIQRIVQPPIRMF